eukprot:CAMPEP_0197836780 /NCGR_PEP_ID=MMETSP1437-20131217/29996_1 /TAXON_ID=49252 ORGANISM="Eucampia antarctica, Strain CCMP1452" /NCGR_SAMPLE_ID=MMETSP1437 /ASSEMBLY_ACC=CAM_ASM_001096 /LENGTH=315 /DNA_ID=CAMNT_0043443233 /DNA_START=119 /DNA_END=1066 /DNA_ORIENTATION=+
MKNVDSDKAARDFVSYFRRNFQYGDFATSGYQSTLTQVQQQQKLLLIYLHSPLHAESTSFCRDKLSLLLLQMTSSHILTCYGASIHSADGNQVAQQLNATQYPHLAIVSVKSSNNNTNNSSSHSITLELHLQIFGKALLSANMAMLSQYINSICSRQETVLAEAVMRRLQLEEETRLREEQDAEYKATLELDRRREQERREAEQLVIEEEEQNKERIQKMRSLLEANNGGTDVAIRFVLPTGIKLEQNFTSLDTLPTLFAFIKLESMDRNLMSATRFGLSTTYPRKNLNDLPEESTLEQADLVPQAVIMVQDLDA